MHQIQTYVLIPFLAVRSIALQVAPKPTAKTVWSLHIPKAGSSFVTWCPHHEVCSDERQKEDAGYLYHQPVPAQAASAFLAEVIVMFREPAQRLASMLEYLKRIGEHIPGWGWNCTYADQLQGERNCNQDRVFDLVMKGKTPANDAYLGKSFLGCQTNMLIGRLCNEGGTRSEAEIREAKRRVDQFLFVGLQNEWALSACLFNYRVTGERFVEQWGLVNARPTVSTKKGNPSIGGSGTSTEYDTRGYPKDPADDVVYAHAADRFWRETKEFGITPEACAHTRNGDPIDWPSFT